MSFPKSVEPENDETVYLYVEILKGGQGQAFTGCLLAKCCTR